MLSVRDNRHVADVKEQVFRCGAGNAKAPSGPREPSTCSVASRSFCTRVSIVAVVGMRGTSRDR